MDITKTTKILLTATCLLLLSDYITRTNAQDEKPEKPRNRLLPPPFNVRQGIFPFGQTLTQDTAIVIWEGPAEATSYDVVIFKAENRELILHEEIDNVHKKRAEFKELEHSTNYEVLVTSVRVRLDGTTERSVQSHPYKFRTLDPCEGGQEHSACNGHCTPTCVKQKPVCDRRCVSGCACPRRAPFLHNGVCMNKKACESAGAPITEVLSRPEDLKVHKMKDSNDVLFTWAPVEGADFYTVTVTLRDGTVVKEIDNIKIPFVIIPGLTPKTPYRFKVVAKYIKFSPARVVGIGPMPKPDPPKISQISDTSIYVSWLEFPTAKSYKVILYDPGNDDQLLRVFKNMKQTFVTIQGLSPGTTYDVSIMATTLIGTEPESMKSSVKTLGEKSDEEDVNELTYEIEATTSTTVATTTTKPRIPSCEERRSALEAYIEDNPDSGEFLPDCAPDGKYRAMQCPKRCYCVDRVTGEKKMGSDFDGPKASHALDCHKYGRFDIEPLSVSVSARNTSTIKVRWDKVEKAKFYIVKLYEGFSSNLIRHVTGVTRGNVHIHGLKGGESYIVTVIAVNADGITSTDKVKGKFVMTPYLDPPNIIKLSQLEDSKMKATWEKNGDALHYLVEVFGESSKHPMMTYENVTEDHVIFDVEGQETYRVRIQSTGVTTIPGSGRQIPVASNAVETMRRPTSCVAPPLDIIYVIDASAKVNEEDFIKAKEFFVELTKSLGPISTSMQDGDGTRVAVVKAFGDSARSIFRFHRFTNIVNLIGSLRFVRQSTSRKLNVGKMLEYVHKTFFTSVNDDDQRPAAQTAVVTFMGSHSDDRNFAKKAAQLRKATNVISVGVRGRVGDYDITTASPENMRVMIPSYDDIETGVEKVMEILCNLK